MRRRICSTSAARLGETSNLQELDGHEIVFVARFPGKHLVNVDFAVGYRLPAVFTASGRAMLSRLDAPARRDIVRSTPLKPVTPYTETDAKLLLAHIDEAAEKGYSIVMNQTAGRRHLGRRRDHRSPRPSGRRDQRRGADDALERRAGRGTARAARAAGSDLDLAVEDAARLSAARPAYVNKGNDSQVEWPEGTQFACTARRRSPPASFSPTRHAQWAAGRLSSRHGVSACRCQIGL